MKNTINLSAIAIRPPTTPARACLRVGAAPVTFAVTRRAAAFWVPTVAINQGVRAL